MNSQQIAGEVGAHVKEATGLAVDLTNPDVTVHVEIVSGRAYVGTERFEAPGGLPLGSSGKFLVMMSGGIDSPVASYEIMKRGGLCDFIHFTSAPFTSRASVEKVEELVRILEQYEGTARLELSAFADIQKEIMMKTPEQFRVLLYRRAMVRIAKIWGRLRRRRSKTSQSSRTRPRSPFFGHCSPGTSRTSLTKRARSGLTTFQSARTKIAAPCLCRKIRQRGRGLRRFGKSNVARHFMCRSIEAGDKPPRYICHY